MADINIVTFTGRLTADPDLKNVNDKAICKFRLAVSKDYKREGEDEAIFLSVTAWQKLADICGQYLKKGARVGVSGRLDGGRLYQTQNGETRFSLDMTIEKMVMLDKRPDGNGEQESAPTQAQPRQAAPRSQAQPRAQPAARTQAKPALDDYGADDLPFN